MISPARQAPEQEPKASAMPSDESSDEPQESSPLDSLREHFAELREYVAYYLATQSDLVRARIRRVVLLAAAGGIAAIVFVTVLAKAALLVVEGLAGGAGILIGDQLWAGQLIVGTAVLLLVFVAGLAVFMWSSSSSRRRSKKKYAQRRRRQQNQYGRDVAQRARTRTSKV